ncbi:unnamed protein product [Lepidochelys olivacea]
MTYWILPLGDKLTIHVSQERRVRACLAVKCCKDFGGLGQLKMTPQGPSPVRRTEERNCDCAGHLSPSPAQSSALPKAQSRPIHLSSAAHVSDRTWLPFIDPQLFPSAEPEKLQSERESVSLWVPVTRKGPWSQRPGIVSWCVQWWQWWGC